ncbi:helix-turn-helix transcriptional regulator [Thioclava sp. GXIMD2076]|uniref:helix-turn-helix transcriptional regulator n=1 Tax=unclassified Thioclava TaxID=2621713 RepID=UPI0030D5A42B
MGNKLKYYRQKRGYTLQQLGKLSGYAGPTLGNAENGKRNPSVEMISRLAEIYGVSANELLDDTPLSSVDEQIRDHAELLRSMSDEERMAVIRHAQALASKH